MSVLDIGKDEHAAFVSIGRGIRAVVRRWEDSVSTENGDPSDEAFAMEWSQRFIDFNYRAGVTGGRQLSLRTTAATFERLYVLLEGLSGEQLHFGSDDDGPEAA